MVSSLQLRHRILTISGASIEEPDPGVDPGVFRGVERGVEHGVDCGVAVGVDCGVGVELEASESVDNTLSIAR